MILQTVNQLMMKIAITKLSPLPWHYSSPKDKQIFMSGMYMAHRKCYITPEGRYHNWWALIQFMKKSQNQQKDSWLMNLKYILDQSKQSIYAKNNKQPTVTLITTFLKSKGRENNYVRFGYLPQTICYHIGGEVSGSICADMINMNKQFRNPRWYDQK